VSPFSPKSEPSRAKPGFTRVPWRYRIDPSFMNYWAAKKKNQLLSRIKDEAKSKQFFAEWFREFVTASRALKAATARLENPVAGKIQQAMLQPLDWESPPRTDLPSTSVGENAIAYPENPEASPMFRKLVFLKYGVTFRELIRQIDIERSAAAHRKLMAVHRDYWRLLNGGLLRDFKLKFSSDHFDIITHGLDFGFNKLTSDELAECLDEICPCEQRHSPEYLKKLRPRIRKASALAFGNDE